MKLNCTAFFCLLYFTAAAQQNEVELNTVTVSAALKQQAAVQSGRNITVIGAEYFNQLPVHSIDELLRYLPGIEVQQRGPAGAQSDIVIRGGTFQQVLVILDGIRLNDPNTGHFNSYIPIAPAEIERIEILKGAASAVYGSEAVGGVIYITTKTFVAKRNDHKKQLQAQATGGEYGLWAANAGGWYQNKNTAVSGGILLNKSRGQLQRGTRGDYATYTASLSAGHYFNPYWHLAVRTAYDSRKFSAQNFYTVFKSDTARETVATLWNQVALQFEKGKNKLTAEAGYKTVTDKYAFNTVAAANKNISSLLQFGTRYEYTFSASTSIISGMQLQYKTITSNDRGNHHLKQVAGFVIVNQAIGKKISLSPAVRVDHTDNSGTELVPQLNISYALKNIQLRASAGNTIRQADFTERYNNYNKALVTGGSIGNPFLEAEQSFSYEAGADFFIKKQLKIAAGIFRRDQRQLIDWTTTPYSQMPRKDNLAPAGTYALAKNIASVNTSGFETDIQYNTSLPNDQKIWATAGVVWLDSKSSQAIPSFYINSHAKLLTNFAVVYSNKYFRLSANALYKTRLKQLASAINATISKDYFLTNTKAEAFVIKNTGTVFVECTNVFNRQYSDLLGAQMPMRWLMAGFSVKLK